MSDVYGSGVGSGKLAVDEPKPKLYPKKVPMTGRHSHLKILFNPHHEDAGVRFGHLMEP